MNILSYRNQLAAGFITSTAAFIAKQYLGDALANIFPGAMKVALTAGVLFAGYKVAQSIHHSQADSVADFLENRGIEIALALDLADKGRDIAALGILAASSLPLGYTLYQLS